MKPAPVTRHTAYADLPEWMSVEELQAYLALGRTAAYDAVKSGKFRTVKVGRLVRIHKAAFAPSEAA